MVRSKLRKKFLKSRSKSDKKAYNKQRNNKYFQNLVPNLNLKVPSKLLCQAPENGDEVLAAIYKYQNHPSIKTILEKHNFSFSFNTVSLADIEKEIKS